MWKGFINFKSGKIPFVIENYHLELFSDDSLLTDFTKEYNFKTNYILTGRCFSFGAPQEITMLVERSIGSTCYLTCFLINIIVGDDRDKFNAINFHSDTLDAIFRYKYHYLDVSRSGENLAAKQKEVYHIPFEIDKYDYNLKYVIGHKHQMGLLETFEMRGESIIRLKTSNILECYRITVLIERFMKFMSSSSDVSFQRIILSNGGHRVAFFYCKYVSDEPTAGFDVGYFNFDVMKYVPKILDNLALDLDNRITKSIHLGHIGNFETSYTPQRFIEQVMAFEYLFQKLEPKKAQQKNFPLKDELQFMFNSFPDILKNYRYQADEIAEKIKRLRVDIAHGYAYYYDFASNLDNQYFTIVLDELIESMNLRLIGLSDSDILQFRK